MNTLNVPKTAALLMIALTASVAHADLAQDLAAAQRGDIASLGQTAPLPSGLAASLHEFAARCLAQTPSHTKNGIEYAATWTVRCTGEMSNTKHASANDGAFEQGQIALDSGTLSYLAVIGDGMDADNNSLFFYDNQGQPVGSYFWTSDALSSAVDFIAEVAKN